MTRLSFLGAFLFVVCSSLAQAQTPAKDKDNPSAALAAKVKEMAADLKEARELLAKVADKPTRDRLELLITRSELRAVELEKSLVASPPLPARRRCRLKISPN